MRKFRTTVLILDNTLNTVSSFPFRNNEWMLDQLLSTDLTFKEALDNSWGETTLRGLETLLYSLFDPWPSFSTKVGTTIM